MAWQTDVLEVTLVDPNQTGKALSINEGLEGLANSQGGELALALGALSTPYTLPYNAADGGDKSGLQVFLYRCSGSPAGTFTVIHPDVRHYFVVVNASSQSVIFKTAAGTGITITAGNSSNLYCNGTDVEDVGSLAGSVGGLYDFGFSTPDGIVPTASQVLGRLVAARTISVPANMAGSVGSIEVNPTSSFVIDVKDDGTTIGTITISTGGVFTFATTSGTAKTIAIGSKIEFVAPAGVDATAEGIAATIKASA